MRKLTEDSWLRKTPETNGARIKRLPEDLLLQVHDTSADAAWILVKPMPPFESVPKGWLEIGSTVVAGVDDIAKEVDMPAFLRSCTFAARQRDLVEPDGPYFVDRDYLIALAIHETGIRNIASAIPGSDATGPYQITVAQWHRFLDSLQPGSGFEPETRLSPTQQPQAQALFIAEAMKTLMDAVSTAPAGEAGSGPYVPNSIELFLVHAFGAAAGKEIFLQKRNGGGGKSVRKIVAEHAGTEAEAIAAKQKALLVKANGNDETVAGVFDKIETLLAPHLLKAYQLLKQHTPEDLPVVAGGSAPWFGKAKDELRLNVARIPGPKHHPDIMKYHASTTLNAQSDETPWCAAFVSWCMANSGEPKVVAANIRSARAADWKGWGVDLPRAADKIPVGAVVVLSPAPGSDSSGHVGFFVKREGASQVKLLGGNQSDALNINPFPNSKIVAVRWLELQDVPVSELDNGGTSVVGPLGGQDWETYRAVLGDAESTNNYAAENSLGYIGRWQFGNLALQDINYVRPGTTLPDLSNTLSWLGKNGIKSKQDWLSKSTVQDEALVEYTRLYYKRLRLNGVLNPNDSKGRVAGFLAAAHLVGPTGALKFSQGKVIGDGNGTKASTYFAKSPF